MANPHEEKAAELRAEEVEAKVGHPVERWDALKARVQDQGIKLFVDVQADWLDLMWCLDAYRKAQAPPKNMGKPGDDWEARLAGAYRGKGNLFATLLTLLLDNRTGEKLRSRDKIQGFSQNHQIDLAWPDRKIDPIVCAESKVSGAPGYGTTRARAARDDWSNRRKELKFAATDLKLARRKQTEDIGHWDVWRKAALPKCFILWAARLAPEDTIERMVKESEALVATYLDGAGIVAWEDRADGTGYEIVKHPTSAPGLQVVELDGVLWKIESEIKAAKQAGLHKAADAPAAPVDPDKLVPDSNAD